LSEVANKYSLLETFRDGVVPVDDKLLQGISLSHEELEGLGREAMAIGSSGERVHEIGIKLPDRPDKEDMVEYGFPDQSRNARRVDGTQNIMPQEIDKRYRRGPSWKKNSGGLDCFLVAALLLDVGRVQVDQVWEGLLKSASNAGKLLLTTVRKPWGELPPKEIDSLRDILRDQLNDEFKFSFQAGNPLKIEDLVYVFGQAVPQFQATWTTLYSCCDKGKWRWFFQYDEPVISEADEHDEPVISEADKHDEPVIPGADEHDEPGISEADRHETNRGIMLNQRTGIRIADFQLEAFEDRAYSLEEAVQLLLMPMALSEVKTKVERCGDPDCKANTRYLDCILDRPPPTLLLPDFESKAGREGQKGMLEDLKLRFYVWNSATQRMEDEMETRYTLWGCIVRPSEAGSADHYILYANPGARERKSKWVMYDARLYDGEVKPATFSRRDILQRYDVVLQIYYKV
jgi:hypothetical protein